MITLNKEDDIKNFEKKIEEMFYELLDGEDYKVFQFYKKTAKEEEFLYVIGIVISDNKNIMDSITIPKSMIKTYINAEKTRYGRLYINKENKKHTTNVPYKIEIFEEDFEKIKSFAKSEIFRIFIGGNE